MAFEFPTTTSPADAIDAFVTLQSRKTTGAACGTALVAEALTLKGHAYVSSPDRSECFDCVTMVNAMTGADIPASWMDDGGTLPFKAIDPADAQPGDVLIFYRRDWQARPWFASIMTACDKHVGVPSARAAGEMWLGPTWRSHLVAAYRVV